MELDVPVGKEGARILQERWVRAGLLAVDVRLVATEVEELSQSPNGLGQCIWAVSEQGLFLQPLSDELALTELGFGWAWRLRAVRTGKGLLLEVVEKLTGRLQHSGKMGNPDPFFVDRLHELTRSQGHLLEDF
ncbi:hypothetical protein ACLQ2S_25715 [Micromonospora sp. DT48]|uniref:hypothetical protein n=1 Tax=Micromonospora sp. DT48 TaxID=3393429 RepID=UPI003CFA3B4A